MDKPPCNGEAAGGSFAQTTPPSEGQERALGGRSDVSRRTLHLLSAVSQGPESTAVGQSRASTSVLVRRRTKVALNVVSRAAHEK